MVRYEPDTPDTDPNYPQNPIYPCPAGYKREGGRQDGECVPDSTPTYDQTPCPQGPNWARKPDGTCIELFPGDDDPNTNGCGNNQHWDEGQQRCVEGAASSNSSSTSSTGTYKPPSNAPKKSPYDDAMSKTLFDTLTNMINGGDAPFGPDTIAKLQAAALQSNKSQLGNSRTELQKRLINSGLSRSGVAPSSYQKLESAAGADLSNNLRTVAVTAVQKNYDARVNALNQAQTFLQSERANSLSQDQLILAYARLNQEWKTTQATFDQQWKIVQDGNEQEMAKLMICLRTGVC